jgi:hypothetical protein
MHAVFIKESLKESLASDAATFALLLFCIWFSREMGGGVWEFACVAMLIFWLSVRLPMETPRYIKLHSKAEAIKWAQSLPEDTP